jgi:arsenate reductase-like glutaredoxin family protein
VDNLSERDLILEPLSVQEITELAREAGSVEALLSKKSPKYKEYQDRVAKPDDWIPFMAEEPRLIRRPMLAVPGRLLIGFDQKVWQEALSH